MLAPLLAAGSAGCVVVGCVSVVVVVGAGLATSGSGVVVMFFGVTEGSVVPVRPASPAARDLRPDVPRRAADLDAVAASGVMPPSKFAEQTE